MRPLSALILPLALTLLAAGCAGGIHQIKTAGVATVALAKLEADPAKHGFGAGKDGKPRFPEKGIIVKIPAGARVPMRLSLDVGVATLEPADNKLRLNRDVLIYIARGRFAISPDGQRWANIHDLEAVKELFGLKGRGSLGFGFGISKDKGAGFHLAVTQPGG